MEELINLLLNNKDISEAVTLEVDKKVGSQGVEEEKESVTFIVADSIIDTKVKSHPNLLASGKSRVIQVTALPYNSSGVLDADALTGLDESLSPSYDKETDETTRLVTFEEAEVYAKLNTPLSILDGGDLCIPENTPNTLIELLIRAANGSTGKLRFIEFDGEDSSMTYSELLTRASRICGGLLGRGLKKETTVIFQLNDASNFFSLFWGTVLAGLHPVPQAFVKTFCGESQASSKLLSIVAAFPDSIVVTEEANLAACCNFFSEVLANEVKVASIESLLSSPAVDPTNVLPNDIAVLLQTSGSTSAPKIVPQTHRRLINRSLATCMVNGFTSDEVTLNCFPLDHVCALIMFHVRDVFLACEQVHVGVESFLCDPVRFLELCERFTVTATWAPNFAFNLINARCNEIELRQFDLSRLWFIENCAEAVVASQNRAFLRLTSRFGVPENAIRPAWGMSETCSVITISNEFNLSSIDKESRSVKVGPPFPGIKLRVVDTLGQVVKQGVVGNLHVTGTTVFDGYLKNSKANAESFTDDGWFDTGDLALISDGELCIIGRAKDSLIINGQNFGGHEIEERVDSILGVEPSCTAAISVRDEADSTDRIAIFFYSKFQGEALKQVLSAIRQDITRYFGVSPEYLIPVNPNDIPRTSIGKIRKELLRSAFYQGKLRPMKTGRISRDVQMPLKLTVNNVSRIKWVFRQLPIQGRVSPAQDFSMISVIADCVSDEVLSLIAINSPWKEINWIQSSSLDFKIESLKRSDVIVILVNESEKDSEIADQLCNRIESLAKILSTLAAGALQLTTSIYVVSQLAQYVEGFQESIDIVNGALPSFVSSISAEYNKGVLRYLDVDNLRFLLSRIADEFITVQRETEVCYRNGRRLVRRLVSVHEVDVAQSTNYQCTLIVGGGGGIGIMLARHILAQGGERVIILGRKSLRKLDHSSRLAVDELSLLYPGAIDYIANDIADASAASELFASLASESKLPSRVFHLAGVLQQGSAYDASASSIRYQLSSKVEGSINLLREAERHKISELIFFTSVNGLFGGAGVALYSAANRFQEVLSVHAALNKHQTKIRTIAWSMWRGVGMSAGSESEQLVELAGYCVLNPNDAVNTLDSLMRGLPQPQIVGVSITSSRMKGLVEWSCAPATVKSKFVRQSVSKLNTDDSGFESELVAVWNQALGRSDVEASDNVFDIGGTSLALHSVISLFEQRTDIKISVADFFENPHICDLALMIDARNTRIA
ncbi:SDR family NAD(P)-dependent oxidoreductase [Pseudomonas syringae]|uniref:SDR family NAD(P)-dependent oxidoreductase n=1 Tax=Pseudomonas syringae TaxID=317 RepID=UPI003D801872